MCNLEQIGCQILTEHENLVEIEEMNLEYTIRVNADQDSEDFGSHTLNRFYFYKSLAKHVYNYLAKNSKVVKSTYVDVVRVEAISKIMEISDLPTVRDVIIKFKALKDNP